MHNQLDEDLNVHWYDTSSRHQTALRGSNVENTHATVAIKHKHHLYIHCVHPLRLEAVSCVPAVRPVRRVSVSKNPAVRIERRGFISYLSSAGGDLFGRRRWWRLAGSARRRKDHPVREGWSTDTNGSKTIY